MRNLIMIGSATTSTSILICLLFLSPYAKTALAAAALSQNSATSSSTNNHQKTILHRRAFVVESLARSFTFGTTTTATTTSIIFRPTVAHSEEEEREGGGDDGSLDSFLKAAQQRSAIRAKEAAEKSREAAERRKEAAERKKEQQQRSGSKTAASRGGEEEDDGDGFVFKSKVEEIQTDIIERRTKVREFDKQETIRSQENEFIKELKARSEANKEQYMKEATRADKLSTKQFKDNLNRPSYVGVTRSDGSIKMITTQQFKELEEAGRVKIEYETAISKNGREYMDYSKRLLRLIGNDDDYGLQSDTTPTLTDTEIETAVEESVITPTTENKGKRGRNKRGGRDDDAPNKRDANNNKGKKRRKKRVESVNGQKSEAPIETETEAVIESLTVPTNEATNNRGKKERKRRGERDKAPNTRVTSNKGKKGRKKREEHEKSEASIKTETEAETVKESVTVPATKGTNNKGKKEKKRRGEGKRDNASTTRVTNKKGKTGRKEREEERNDGQQSKKTKEMKTEMDTEIVIESVDMPPTEPIKKRKKRKIGFYEYDL